MLPPFSLEQTIEKTVRDEWGRILASLIKMVGDIQLAEDCLHDAVVAAMGNWQSHGLPRSPAAWLITAARRKAIDQLRKQQTHMSKSAEIAYLSALEHEAGQEDEDAEIPDKRLELIFACCHPSLEEKTRIALTLRTLGGLSTEEIATAFLDTGDAMQRRLSRAKRKISAAGIPYKVPDAEDLPERLSAVLNVLYLIFNEGYTASGGEKLIRTDLVDEATRLTRIIGNLMPGETEVQGLLALMLLHDSRRLARLGPGGEMVPLEHQKRSRWNKAKIAEGTAILSETLPKRRIGPYQLQAAISAVHAQADKWDNTDWNEICALYAMLHELQPTAIVSINRAMAISHTGAIGDALALLDRAAQEAVLDRYQPFFVARADLLFRSGNYREAIRCLEKAIDLTDNLQERDFLTLKAEKYKAAT